METQIIQISAGRGPAECSWVVAKFLDYLIKKTKYNKLEYNVLNLVKGPINRTVSSVLIEIKGDNIDEFIKPYCGTIQWIGQSPFRKLHKRKNWFIDVSKVNDVNEIKFDERDLKFTTYRSSGPGGQHRNKVETAVRVEHKPTGLVCTAEDSKSQLQNKKSVIEKMKTKIKEHQLQNVHNQVNEAWNLHLNIERGNPVKVFKGVDFK